MTSPRRIAPRAISRLARAIAAASLLAPAAASASPLFELSGATIGGGGFNARVVGESFARASR